MDNPQIIKTPSGEDMVVLARDDYDALLAALADAQDELADIAVLDKRLAEMAAAPDPLRPAAISVLLLKGYRRLEAVRLWRGLTPAELAKNVGISEGMLDGLERGAPADLAVVSELAKALDVPSTWID